MKRIFMWAPLFILPLCSSVAMAISKPAPGTAAPAGDSAGIPSVYLWVAGAMVIVLAVWLWRGRAGGRR